MRAQRFLVVSAVAIVVAGSSLLGCSKSGTSPTNPYGGSPGGPPGGAFNSGTMTAPNDFVHVFSTAGTVGYHCNFHVSYGMTGTVTVVAGAADSAVVTASGMTFTPASVSIKPGGYVHWSVVSGTHTVTSN